MFDAIIGPGSALRNRYELAPEKRRRIYETLSSMLKNDMTLTQSLESLIDIARRVKNQGQRALLERWLVRVVDGQLFAVAAAELPESDRVILSAGEDANGLADILERVLFLEDARKAMRSELVNGLSKPAILLFATIGLMVMITTSIVPVYAEQIPMDQWKGLALALSGLAYFTVYILPFVIVIFMLALMAALWSCSRWTGSIRQVFDRFPPWSIYRIIESSAFLIAIGTMAKTMAVSDAVQRLHVKAGPWLRERTGLALVNLDNGDLLASAFHKTGINFPQIDVLNELLAYEKLDSFNDILLKLAMQSLQKTLRQIKLQMGILNTLSMLVFTTVLLVVIGGNVGLQQMFANLQSGAN